MSESVAGRLAIISADPPITYPCIVSPNVDRVGELYARQVQLLAQPPARQIQLLAQPPARQIQLLAQTQVQCTISLILLYCTYGHNGIIWSLV